MTAYHSYAVADGHGLPHDPLKAIVAPRPIGWISTLAADGVPNLAPYSFFNMVGDSPPMLAFSSSGRKDSLANAEATGAFVWNLATRSLAEAMNRSSAPVGADVDEFVLAGLKTASAMIVDVPRVAESPASLECRVVQIIELRDLDDRATNQWLVIGQVVAAHIRTDCLRDGLFDTGIANAILRAGYQADYVEVRPEAMFRMRRPTA